MKIVFMYELPASFQRIYVADLRLYLHPGDSPGMISVTHPTMASEIPRWFLLYGYTTASWLWLCRFVYKMCYHK